MSEVEKSFSTLNSTMWRKGSRQQTGKWKIFPLITIKQHLRVLL
jgi:hypothetical protein